MPEMPPNVRKNPPVPPESTADPSVNGTSATPLRRGPTVGAELVARVQAGDRVAFRRVYDLLVGRLYAICLRILRDPALAEDALQTTFVRIWQHAPTVRSPAAFTGWSCRVGTNTALQLLRSQPDFDALDPEGSDGPHAASVPGGDHLDLERAIATLPSRRRAVLVLHDIEGYRHKEIGGLLGISEGTSKAHLFQARETLKKFLKS